MSHRCIHSTYAAAECTIDQLMREGDAGGVGRGKGEGGGERASAIVESAARVAYGGAADSRRENRLAYPTSASGIGSGRGGGEERTGSVRGVTYRSFVFVNWAPSHLEKPIGRGGVV
jgi:hypothetical protein